jgi:hypothetical protein
MLSRLPACSLGWFLASMSSCEQAGPMAVHLANMQAIKQHGMDAGEPSIMPAFRLCRLLAGTDFHREKRPKHCLGEKCDVKISASAFTWAVNAHGTVYRNGVDCWVLAMASAVAVGAGLCPAQLARASAPRSAMLADAVFG